MTRVRLKLISLARRLAAAPGRAGAALGFVAAAVLAHWRDEDLEDWIKMLRETRLKLRARQPTEAG
jgi:hypothetical protein